MATNFPTSLDNGTSLPYPTSTNFTNGPSLSGGQDNQNDALIAVETKLGTGASTPSGTNLLVSTGTGTSSWSKAAPTGTIVGISDSQTLTNKTLTSPTINSPTITNATISTDLITGFTTSNNGSIYGMSVTGGLLASAAILGQVNTAALQTNAVGAANLATNAITLGYAQITTSFSTTSGTAVQVTGLTVTVTIPSGGRKTKITAFAPGLYNNSSTVNTTMSIWNGTVGSGTQLSYGYGLNNGSAASGGLAMAIITPSAGSQTYNVGLLRGASGTSTVEASSVGPAFILVEAI